MRKRQNNQQNRAKMIGKQKKLAWAQLAYENAEKHGFWDNTSIEHHMALVVCELAEAIEADRKGRRSNLQAYERNLTRLLHDHTYQNGDKEELFREFVKDSVEDELADAYIRLLQIGGRYGFKQYDAQLDEQLNRIKASNTFTENMYVIMQAVATPTMRLMVKATLVRGMGMLERVAECIGFNLEAHVLAKMEYNASRPYKHNKKY